MNPLELPQVKDVVAGVQPPQTVEALLAALVIVEQLEPSRYCLFHAVRANLLERLGRRNEAAAADESALACDQNPAERTFLERRRRAISSAKST